MIVPGIYLAGGMVTNWREEVTNKIIEACPNKNITFYNPATSDLDTPESYTLWDLEAIGNSDIVLAYLEKGNPSGYGMSVEVGYAKGLGKTIILVDEKDNKYTQFIRHTADAVCKDVDDAVKLIVQLVQI